MKKPFSLLAAMLITLTSISGVASAETTTNQISTDQTQTTFINNVTESTELKQFIGQNNVVGWEVTKLSPEEFYKRYAEITGTSVEQAKNIHTSKQGVSPLNLNQTYDAQYVAVIDLGGGVRVKAGVLVQIQEVQFGGSLGRIFLKVYDNTGYVAPYSGSFTVVKNFVQGTLQSSSKLQVSYSGYAETAVVNGTSNQLNLSAGELVNLGWSASTSTQTTTYYRKHFDGTGYVSP
ncbi:hypothetical protein [Paenibacillus sp. RC84]|uniref:hypothetical protein n=1 Tax=Paenibacillus sp. RC84 TaxID=3156252 RepID=UPI003518CD67